MPEVERVLRPPAAQAYYDRFGEKQDRQGFYEDPALDDLVAHADFPGARSVFEFGCGTGKFAARLLDKHLPVTAGYSGCDLSPVMAGLAQRRLQSFGARARVTVTDGSILFPCPDRSADRVVSTYVLDLLPEAGIRRFFAEARRVCLPGGIVCLASLTRGVDLRSRIVSSAWAAIFRLRPSVVGGCRPIVLEPFVDPAYWRVVHRNVATPFGVPSEILVLAAEEPPGGGEGGQGLRDRTPSRTPGEIR
jgi:ubiquinone/menaquinone biosynthesis C-methylase UbiE